MNKHRVNTTISAKYWEILKKRTEKFGTQQKVLEAALESLENSSKQNPLSPEDDLLLRYHKEYGFNLCVLHKTIIKEFLKFGGFDQIIKIVDVMNMTETQVVFFCKKPLKECNLREIMEAIVHNFRLVNIFDIVEYEDYDTFYLLSITHYLDLGADSQTSLKLLFEKLFEKCGVTTESELSENNLFMKIYKNSK
ncbi:MAG: hypothetical protein OIN86_00035 [Candidatus Methanoperedens sp.]|nr:hypothetical protein [Candidatus Methanoperedens sp.]CAG1007382.1 hypothetical protein METP1_03443 [Methanosarcinales archaeon]